MEIILYTRETFYLLEKRNVDGDDYTSCKYFQLFKSKSKVWYKTKEEETWNSFDKKE